MFFSIFIKRESFEEKGFEGKIGIDTGVKGCSYKKGIQKKEKVFYRMCNIFFMDGNFVILNINNVIIEKIKNKVIYECWSL